MPTKILDISSGSTDWRAHALSNFPCFPFTLDNVLFASPEGFIQGIKFPPDDPRRQQAFGTWGKYAKAIGEEAQREHIWWEEDRYTYNSVNHKMLIKRGIRAKFYFNHGARFALTATGTMKLVHDVGPESPHTSLTAQSFCKILTEIRIALKNGTLDPP